VTVRVLSVKHSGQHPLGNVLLDAGFAARLKHLLKRTAAPTRWS
jgi:hypothetical protein